MADPFGIIGVLGVAAQVMQECVKFGLNWKDAPTDVKGFVRELQSLKTVLSETNTNILTNPEFQEAFRGGRSALISELGDPQALTDTRAMILACKKALDSVLATLQKRAQGSRLGWERIKAALKATRTLESVQSLHRQCQLLNSLVAVDSLALAVETNLEVKEVKKHIEDQADDAEKRKILEWLSPVDFGSVQNDMFSRRQEGTG